MADPRADVPWHELRKIHAPAVRLLRASLDPYGWSRQPKGILSFGRDHRGAKERIFRFRDLSRNGTIAAMRGNDSRARTVESGSPTRFETTQWKVVLAAANGSSPDAQEALAQLLQTYWKPLYIHVRHRGFSTEDAQDLIQDFFYQLIQRHRLGLANPERGRFRSFLLASLNHFLSNEQEARRAVKRGGRVRLLPLSGEEMEAGYAVVLAEDLTPEKAFDRYWALTVLDVVLGRLRREQESFGKGENFERLKPFLESDQPPPRYAEVAARLNVSEGAARMMVLRLRRRYRALIQEEIARTLADPAQVREELHSLVAALRGEL